MAVFAAVLIGLSLFVSGPDDTLTPELLEQNKMPAEHFICMGLNSDTSGEYCGEDVETTMSIYGLEAKKEYLRAEILARIEELGAVGLLEHLQKKTIQGLSYGTFALHRVWKGVLLNNGRVAHMLQFFLVTDMRGWDAFTAPMLQTLYLILMGGSVLSGVTALRRRSKVDRRQLYITSAVRISIIGMLIFLLLLECNVRYFYTLMPLVILLFTCVVARAFDKNRPADQLAEPS